MAGFSLLDKIIEKEVLKKKQLVANNKKEMSMNDYINSLGLSMSVSIWFGIEVFRTVNQKYINRWTFKEWGNVTINK